MDAGIQQPPDLACPFLLTHNARGFALIFRKKSLRKQQEVSRGQPGNMYILSMVQIHNDYILSLFIEDCNVKQDTRSGRI